MAYHHGQAKAGAKPGAKEGAKAGAAPLAIDLIAPERPRRRMRSAANSPTAFTAPFLTVVDAEFEDLGPATDAGSPRPQGPRPAKSAASAISSLRPQGGFVTAGEVPDAGRSVSGFRALAGFLCLLSFWVCGGHALAERALSVLAPASVQASAASIADPAPVSASPALREGGAVLLHDKAMAPPTVIAGGRVMPSRSSLTRIVDVPADEMPSLR